MKDIELLKEALDELTTAMSSGKYVYGSDLIKVAELKAVVEDAKDTLLGSTKKMKKKDAWKIILTVQQYRMLTAILTNLDKVEIYDYKISQKWGVDKPLKDKWLTSTKILEMMYL